MDQTNSHDGLKYVGDGTAIVGVPARDLTAEEMQALDKHLLALALASGLYVLIGKKAYTPKPRKSALKKEGTGEEHADKE